MTDIDTYTHGKILVLMQGRASSDKFSCDGCVEEKVVKDLVNKKKQNPIQSTDAIATLLLKAEKNDEDAELEPKAKEFDREQNKAGNINMKAKKFDDALDCYNKAIEHNPLITYIVNRAISYYCLNQPEKSYTDVLSVLEKKPSYLKDVADCIILDPANIRYIDEKISFVFIKRWYQTSSLQNKRLREIFDPTKLAIENLEYAMTLFVNWVNNIGIKANFISQTIETQRAFIYISNAFPQSFASTSISDNDQRTVRVKNRLQKKLQEADKEILPNKPSEVESMAKIETEEQKIKNNKTLRNYKKKQQKKKKREEKLKEDNELVKTDSKELANEDKSEDNE